MLSVLEGVVIVITGAISNTDFAYIQMLSEYDKEFSTRKYSEGNNNKVSKVMCRHLSRKIEYTSVGVSGNPTKIPNINSKQTRLAIMTTKAITFLCYLVREIRIIIL